MRPHVRSGDGLPPIRLRIDRMSTMDAQDEARLVELETRLAFQEHTIGVLNDTVLEQSRALQALGRRLDDAMEDLRRLRTLLLADPGEEPAPPHY